MEINDELKNKLSETIAEFEIIPVSQVKKFFNYQVELKNGYFNFWFYLKFGQQQQQEDPVSLVPDSQHELYPVSEKRPGTTVSWSPPFVNWNPWTGANIDEGFYATVRF